MAASVWRRPAPDWTDGGDQRRRIGDCRGCTRRILWGDAAARSPRLLDPAIQRAAAPTPVAADCGAGLSLALPDRPAAPRSTRGGGPEPGRGHRSSVAD